MGFYKITEWRCSWMASVKKKKKKGVKTTRNVQSKFFPVRINTKRFNEQKKMSSQEVTSVSWSHWNVRECKEAELLQKSFNVTVEK